MEKIKPKVETVNMGAPVYSSPVVANNTLYVATQTHLRHWENNHNSQSWEKLSFGLCL